MGTLCFIWCVTIYLFEFVHFFKCCFINEMSIYDLITKRTSQERQLCFIQFALWELYSVINPKPPKHIVLITWKYMHIFIRLKPVNWISGKQCLKLCNKYRSIVNCFKWYCNISGRTRGNAEEGVHVVDHAWPSDPDRGADGGQGAPRGRRQCYGDLKCVGRSGQETVP